ncbi:MAG: Rid family hydrolase [Pseudomonadota bacterium]
MAEKRQNFSTGSNFEKSFGYSRVVKVGEQVFVSGTVGLNYETGAISDDPVEQFEQSVANIRRALEMAGTRLEDVVQLVTYVTEPEVMQVIGPSLKDTFGAILPTNTALVVGFPFPGIKLELQVTAIVGCGD